MPILRAQGDADGLQAGEHDVMPNKRSEAGKLRKAEANRELRAWYREQGICIGCGQTWAEPGYVRCKACYKKARAREKRSDPDGEKHKAFLKSLRDYRREHGLCIDCGAPTDGKHLRCKAHNDAQNEACRMYKLRKKIKEGRA